MNWSSREGTASPLGITWILEEAAYNFALYSKHASGATLLLFSREDVSRPIYEYEFNPLINKSGRLWHCRLRASEASTARYYAHSVSGRMSLGKGIGSTIKRSWWAPMRAPFTFLNTSAVRLPGCREAMQEKVPWACFWRKPHSPPQCM
jgi:pullulanase/glycogen debranching enzyme